MFLKDIPFRESVFLFILIAATQSRLQCSLANENVELHIRLIDSANGTVTPAMVCISNSKGAKFHEIRLPPDGKILEEVSRRELLSQGVRFSSDHNWIGPARTMLGDGDGIHRSSSYRSAPAIPYWHDPVMYQTSGDFTIQLPPGSWRIAADHGVEHLPEVKEVVVTGKERQPIEVEIHFERWVDMPKRGWWSGDVHVHHTTAEQSHREYLWHFAKAVDLHVVNTLAMGHHGGVEFPQKGFGKQFRTVRDTYALISGQEDPRSTFGHIIGLNLREMVRDLDTYDFYDLVFQDIHRQENASVGYAHFAWNGCDLPRGFPWYVTTEQLDFVELMQYGRMNPPDYYDYLNLGFSLTAAAGSDFPWGSVLGEVRTYVYTGPKFDVDAWFQAFEHGHTFITNGPMLELMVEGQLPGSSIEKEVGEKITITGKVLGHHVIGIPEFLTLIGNDGVLESIKNPTGEPNLEFQIEMNISQSRWLLLSTRCTNGALAMTTPVYVIVNGRPHWCPERGPEIVARQLKVIREIESEFKDDYSPKGRGIQLRLAEARQYYRKLIQQMQLED